MLILNQHTLHGAPLDPADAETLGEAGAAQAQAFFRDHPTYLPTPLNPLPSLAGALGLGEIHVKDEGRRLGLGSFKALGGAYAVVQLVLEQAGKVLGRPVTPAELSAPEVAAIAQGMTFACATAGNHGRSVAYGAALAGARAVVFIPRGAAEGRVKAIAALGAEVVRAAGAYDEALAEVALAADESGWTVVSDTAWEGYERIPGLVMQGYTLILDEALETLAAPPTHLFVHAGVGGLAGALAGRLATRLGADRPTMVVVEPERAACLMESARAGSLQRLAPGLPTAMAMLDCRQPSLSAWRILSRAADAFMMISDDEAVSAVRRLGAPAGADPVIASSESGAAGLAGLIRAAGDPAMREAIGLDAASRVLVVNSEGAAP